MLQKFETRLTLIESLLDSYELKLMWRARVLDHVESSSTNQLLLYTYYTLLFNMYRRLVQVFYVIYFSHLYFHNRHYIYYAHF